MVGRQGSGGDHPGQGRWVHTHTRAFLNCCQLFLKSRSENPSSMYNNQEAHCKGCKNDLSVLTSHFWSTLIVLHGLQVMLL